ncbi:MAG: glycosyltransferase family 39 protein, partial [Anaerolineae bacterium]
MKRYFRSVGLLLLAALTRLWGLEVRSLWMDEAFSHAFATVPPSIAWEAMIVDAVHPPFYYLLLRPWLDLAGGSEFALRFPSVLAGVLTVALVIRAGRQWLGERAGQWAGLLLAVNPFHVWYSQEARMYALLGALAIAVLMAFWWALHDTRSRSWMPLALLSAVTFSTHYFALYLPLVQFIYLLVTFRRHHQALIPWTVTQAAAALPLAAWLVTLYSVDGGTFGIGWIPTPRPTALLKTLWAFSMAYDGRVTPLVVLSVAAWSALLTVGVWRGPGSQSARWLLLLSLILPPLVTFLLSLRRPVYVNRFFIGGVPAFVLLAGAGLMDAPRAVRGAFGVALVGLGLWGVVCFHTDASFIREDWRGVAT